MSTITYKFQLLGDTSVKTNQSRGLSLQFNGFVPVTFKDPDYLVNLLEGGEVETIPTFEEMLSDGSGVAIFPDTSFAYVASQGYPAPNNKTKYSSLLSSLGSSMFDTVSSMGSDEVQLVSSPNVYSSTSTLKIVFNDSDVNANGDVRIDAIVLIGQAYNKDFYSTLQQGTIQDSVAIAIVYFTSDSDNRPVIDPTSKNSSTLITLGLSISCQEASAVDWTTDEATTWLQYADCFHIVNNQLSTTSSFVVKGTGVTAIDGVEWEDAYGELVSEDEDVVEFDTKVFFSNETEDSNYDHNVSFASPARLTVLTKDQVTLSQNGYRQPQIVVGTVKYDASDDDELHGNMAGVHTSLFRYDDSGTLVYENDYFAENKPAINLFSVDIDYDLPSSSEDVSAYWNQYISSGHTEANSNNGNFLFTDSSRGSEFATIINTTAATAFGNSNIMGSYDVLINSPRISETDRGFLQWINAGVYNSTNVDIEQLPEISGELYDVSNIVFGSNNVQIVSTSGAPMKYYSTTEWISNSRNFVANSCGPVLKNTDRVNLIGVSYVPPGRTTDKSFYSGASGWTSSRVDTSYGINAMGGSVSCSYGYGCNILGAYSPTDTISPNRIIGTSSSIVMGATIIGANNTVKGYRIIDDDTDDATYHMSQGYVTLIGKGLVNDALQNYNYKNFCPTLVLGYYNNWYYDSAAFNQLVIGGYSPYPETVKYNCLEVGVSDPGVNNTSDNQRTMVTLQDLKGRRTRYTSVGLEMSWIKGKIGSTDLDERNYVDFGKINWYKLWCLLSRLSWEPTLKGTKGSNQYYVVYTSGSSANSAAHWHDWSQDDTTTFADLVSPDTSYYPYYPQVEFGSWVDWDL